MASFTVSLFRGSVPRVAPHLVKPGMATRAMDCKLTDGTLDSWREPLKRRDTPAGTLSAHPMGACWLDFDKCVDVAYGPVTCQQVFVTGWRDYPVVLDVDQSDCSVTERRLGVPAPTNAPSVVVGALNDSTDKDAEGRSYGYQYVNSASVRGALSPGTKPRMVNDGQTVVVSGWEQPDPDWGVTHVRIYRTVSGESMGKEMARTVDTTWMFVAEVPVTAISYSDSAYNDTLIEALEQDIAYPPPAGLQGIVWIESINTLAGFVGNRVYFSENNGYDYWPHWMDLDDNVCALVESNGLIYAATDGHPYVITGDKGCDNAGCRSAVRLPMPAPMVGCGSRRIAAIPAGAVYPSHKGLVLLSGNAQPSYITWPMYTAEKWQEIHPDTAIPVMVDGKLFVFARNGAFALTMPQGPEVGWDADLHTDLSDRGILDAFVTRQGDFMLLKSDGVYEWDRSETLRPHLWQSQEVVTPRPLNFGAVHMVFQYGAENVKIEVDRRVAADRAVPSSRVLRLPMWACGTRWQITLSGTAKVSLFTMASSVQGLGQ